MLPSTIEALKAVLRTDQTVDPETRNKIIEGLRQPTTKTSEGDEDRILRSGEAARILGRSIRAVDRLARRGLIRKVTFPGSVRAAGYACRDVYRLAHPTTETSEVGGAA